MTTEIHVNNKDIWYNTRNYTETALLGPHRAKVSLVYPIKTLGQVFRRKHFTVNATV